MLYSMRKPTYFLGLMAAATLFIFACGGREDGGGTFSTLLGRIPDTEVTRNGGVHFNDLARFRDLFDITLPDADASDEEVLEYLKAALDVESEHGSIASLARSPWISGFHDRGNLILENREHLAFSVVNVDQTALVELNTNRLEIVKGRFSPSSTKDALAKCQECPSPEIIQHQGIEFYRWTEGLVGTLVDRFLPPVFDSIGRGGQAAVLNSYVFHTLETSNMKLLIDAHLGVVPSLADNTDLALAAKEMDNLGLYSGAFMREDWVKYWKVEDPLDAFDRVCVFYETPENFETCEKRIEKSFAEGLILDNYNTLGMGAGKDENGLFGALIFVHDSESDAVNNEKAFKKIWADGVSFRNGERWKDVIPREPLLKSKGRLLIARFPTDRPFPWMNAWGLSFHIPFWYR